MFTITSRHLGKACTIIFIGIVCGLGLHHNYEVWSNRGLDAYLVREAAVFAKSYAHPRAAIWNIYSLIVLFFLAFGIYELIASVITKIIDRFTPHEKPIQSNPQA